MRIDFYNEQVPDATTLLKFRHLFEKHQIGEKIFSDLKERLDKAGLLMHGGSIVDATIIHAPSSTKNAKGERDAEMHQVKKGNQWYFGMKVHAGVDAGTGFVHTITGTAANVHDSQQISELIRKDDEVVYGASDYLGAPEQDAIKSNESFSKIKFRINKRPSSLKINDCYKGENRDRSIERSKSSVRNKVEHPFLIVKRYFGYCKVVYKGIAKNMNRFNLLFACANLLMCVRDNRNLAPIVG
ncbi:MAG: IS5 family transposase [Akkermansia sp.]|nr:IS5 family transposase [Akkermansia sp.]